MTLTVVIPTSTDGPQYIVVFLMSLDVVQILKIHINLLKFHINLLSPMDAKGLS